MINYSIPKPHPLCGHFVKVNNEAEYQELKAIAESCGFNYIDCYKPTTASGFWFNNYMEVKWYNIRSMSGQEITLPELFQLSRLSRIVLPFETDVWNDDPRYATKRMVVGFYKGCPLVKDGVLTNNLVLWKHFRPINPHAKEIKQIETEIEALTAKLNTLKAIK